MSLLDRSLPPPPKKKRSLVLPNLAQDLVSVQPMDGPVGLIFYFDLVYGKTASKCECGAASVGLTHASYCPLGAKK